MINLLDGKTLALFLIFNSWECFAYVQSLNNLIISWIFSENFLVNCKPSSTRSKCNVNLNAYLEILSLDYGVYLIEFNVIIFNSKRLLWDIDITINVGSFEAVTLKCHLDFKIKRFPDNSTCVPLCFSLWNRGVPWSSHNQGPVIYIVTASLHDKTQMWSGRLSVLTTRPYAVFALGPLSLTQRRDWTISTASPGNQSYKEQQHIVRNYILPGSISTCDTTWTPLRPNI